MRSGELAGYTCHLVVMHSIQRLGPATRVHTDPQATWSAIEQFFDECLTALESAGITNDRLILDPGLGYFLGDTPEPSLTVLANLGRLKTRYNLPILISPSRKSFLRAPSPAPTSPISAQQPSPPSCTPPPRASTTSALTTPPP